MKLLVIFLLVANPYFPLELQEVRKSFYLAIEDSDEAILFQEKLLDVNESHPILLGYKGMAEMALAKHAYNPVSKVTYFNKGKNLLEKAIDLNSTSVELRYLRFSIQTNVPFFLGYKGKIEEDKEMILQYLLQENELKEDMDLKQRMKAFVLDSRYFSNQEKKEVKNDG